MKIINHDYAGHPFQVQLSRSLARRGYQVLHLYAGCNLTPHGRLNLLGGDPANLLIEGIFIREPLQKYSLIKRWQQENQYGKLLVHRINQFKPDIIISGNTPLDAQLSTINHCHKNNIRFVYWLQDLLGIATYVILKRKLFIIGSIVGKRYIRMEKCILQRSDHIISISEDFTPPLLDIGILEKKISVIRNWAPFEDFKISERENTWSEALGISNKFVFLYTGTLGMKHNPNIILQLAMHYKLKSDIVILVLSEGPGAIWLKEKMREHDLNNLIILGYQSYEEMSNVLGSGDVLLAVLEPSAGIYSIPSKVLSYLCAKRPLLLSVPLQNLSAKIVDGIKAGLVVAPEDLSGFLSAADYLYTHNSFRENCGINARKYAEENFNIESITDRFEEIILNSKFQNDFPIKNDF